MTSARVLPLNACPCGNPSGPKCPDCLEYEREERRKRHQARIIHSGLPTSLQGTEYPEGPASNMAKRWANGELPGLCLTGPVGVGKTYLAAAACWHRLQVHGTRWVSVARVMMQLRAGFDDQDRKLAQAAMAGTGAIVLDDLDKVSPTEFGREVLFTAIDNRVEEGAALLVTTNLGMEEIGKRLGPAIMSRLAGYCTVLKLDGADRRVA